MFSTTANILMLVISQTTLIGSATEFLNSCSQKALTIVPSTNPKEDFGELPTEDQIVRYKPGYGVKPLSYDITVEYLQLERFRTMTAIWLQTGTETDRFMFHCKPDDMKAVTVAVVKPDQLRADLCISGLYNDPDSDTVVVKLNVPLPKSILLDVRINMSNTISLESQNDKDEKGRLKSGLQRSFSKAHKTWLLYSNFQMRTARTVFPCLDVPVYSTPFSLSIITRRNWTPFAGTEPLAQLEHGAKDVMKSFFTPTKSIAIQNFAFGISYNWRSIVERDKGPVMVSIRYEQFDDFILATHYQWLFQEVYASIKHLESVTGQPYFFGQMTILLVDTNLMYASQAGLIYFDPNIARSNTPAVKHVLWILIAQQWTGNRLKMADWNSHCLSIGLSVAISWRLKPFPTNPVPRLFNKTFQNYDAVIRRYERFDQCYANCYIKTPMILEMLADHFGKDIWVKILPTLIEAGIKEGQGVDISFWMHMLDMATPNTKLPEALRAWMSNEGYPLLKLEWTGSYASRLVTQYRFVENRVMETTNGNWWIIPLKIMTYYKTYTKLIDDWKKFTLEFNHLAFTLAMGYDDLSFVKVIYTPQDYTMVLNCTDKACQSLPVEVRQRATRDFCYGLATMSVYTVGTGNLQHEKDAMHNYFSKLWNIIARNRQKNLYTMEYSQDCDCCLSSLKALTKSRYPPPKAYMDYCNKNCMQLLELRVFYQSHKAMDFISYNEDGISVKDVNESVILIVPF